MEGVVAPFFSAGDAGLFNKYNIAYNKVVVGNKFYI